MKRFLGLFALATVIITFISCDKQKSVGENPFFEAEWQTPYGVPPFDRIEFEHYRPAFERGMSLHNEEIVAIVESVEKPSFENTILAFDNSGQMLARVRTVFEMLASADTNEQMQALSSEMMPTLAAHHDAILMNEKLFERIKSVYDARNTMKLDAEQRRLVEKIYRQFERSGAMLSADDKQRLKQINEKLTSLSVDFGRNVLAETNAYTLEATQSELLGVPTQVRDAAMDYANSIDKKGKHIFTLQKPSMLPLLTYAQNRELRENIYKAYT
ncbi:MAG: peptidase M3, partial [Alistipes sp.]|nr:peptidase M3 [Alistipes sp.]